MNIKFQKFDKLSITESLVTIVQSLEFTRNDKVVIHESLTTVSDQDMHNSEYTRYMESERNSSPCIQGTTNSNINKQNSVTVTTAFTIEQTPDHNNNKDSVAADPSQTKLLLKNEFEKEDLAKPNDTLSYMSTSSCGYIVTANTEQLVEYDSGQLTEVPPPLYLQASECITRIGSLGSLSSHDDVVSDINANVQFSYSNDYTRPLSEGYVTEQERTDYLEIPQTSLKPDEHRERNEQVLDNYDDLSSEGISICNARINDYVFQKKIDNRLMYPTSSSSGYYSGHTPTSVGNSYLCESDLSYMDSSETGYVYGSSNIDCDDLKQGDGYLDHRVAV